MKTKYSRPPFKQNYAFRGANQLLSLYQMGIQDLVGGGACNLETPGECSRASTVQTTMLLHLHSNASKTIRCACRWFVPRRDRTLAHTVARFAHRDCHFYRVTVTLWALALSKCTMVSPTFVVGQLQPSIAPFTAKFAFPCCVVPRRKGDHMGTDCVFH